MTNIENGFQAHYMTIFLSFVDSSDNYMGSIGDDFFGVFWSIFCEMQHSAPREVFMGQNVIFCA